MASSTTRKRVVICGLYCENSTFTATTSTYDSFTILTGDAQMARYPYLKTPNFVDSSVDFVPAYHARAIPGGRIERGAYDKLKDELLQHVEKVCNVGPVHGIYFDIHGALFTNGMSDVEVDLVTAVKEVVGNSDCLCGASMDLHGNISKELAQNIHIFSAFRTAPHLDYLETREKVCRLMVKCLEEDIMPIRAWIPVPVLLPGEMTSTLAEPGASLYKSLEDVDDTPGLLDISMLVGYVWADEERSHATIIATGTNESGVTSAAETMAKKYWDAREEFCFNMPSGSMVECYEGALEENVAPVVISDSGDNPTAGGVGNLPFALKESLKFQDKLASKTILIVGIWDSPAIDRCYDAGVNSSIELLGIGQNCLKDHCDVVSVTCTVAFLHDSDKTAGRQAVIKIGEGITATLCERRKPFHYIKDFTQLGLDPFSYSIVVVKIGYLVPELQQLASKSYLALTPGGVNQDITNVVYTNVQRPMFPFEKDFAFLPTATIISS